jgi:hypothetical protein
VIASILVVLILGFAVAALVIAMNGGDDGWDDGATEDWQEQIVEDIDQNEANIDYLEGEVDALAKAVGGGGSQKKPASSSPSADSGAQMTQAVKRMQAVAVPTASAASIKSQLFDASGASATLDDVFDTTKALHKAVRGEDWSASSGDASSSSGWAPASREVGRLVSPAASESIPYGKEEVPLEKQFPAAPLQGPGSGEGDGSEPSLTFKDVMKNRQPWHTRSDLQPLVVQRNSTFRSAPSAALDIAAEETEGAMRQFFKNRQRGTDQGYGNLLMHELEMGAM